MRDTRQNTISGDILLDSCFDDQRFVLARSNQTLFPTQLPLDWQILLWIFGGSHGFKVCMVHAFYYVKLLPSTETRFLSIAAIGFAAMILISFLKSIVGKVVARRA